MENFINMVEHTRFAVNLSGESWSSGEREENGRGWGWGWGRERGGVASEGVAK